LNGIGTVTLMTFREARRRRLVLTVVIMGLVFLALFALGFYFVHRNAKFTAVGERPEVMNFFLLTGMYVVNFLVVVLTVLASVDTIAGEISSGTIQTTVTKPLRRWHVVGGKWLGLGAMLSIFVVAMSVAMIGIVWMISRYSPPAAIQGIALMSLEGLVVLSISIFGGTRLTTLANGVIVFMLYGLAFISGWIEQAGALMRNSTLTSIGIVISLVIPSESLWRRAAYLMQPATIRQLGFGPFATASAPSAVMVGYAALYSAALLLLAFRSFQKRDL
jgi:Cu-processing system permease protein